MKPAINSIKRVSALLICAAMLFGCAGQTSSDLSGESAANTDVNNENIENNENSGNSRANAPDSLPALNFEGQNLRVLARGGDEDVIIEFYAEQQDGDVVNEAVYKRNLAVEERLNVKTVLTMSTATRHAHDADAIRNSVTSGSDDYDLIANHMHYTMPLALDNIFYNLNNLPYLDFTQPWWNKSYTGLVNIDGKLYLAAGELSLTMLSGAYCVFFNSDLFESHYPVESLYETVADGKWTLDKLEEYCKGLYTDLNGNSVADPDDFYGLYYMEEQTLESDAFTGGTALDFVKPDGDGYVYALENERTAAFVEKMASLLFENNSACHGTWNDATQMHTMLTGTTVFTPWMLGGINYLRDMEDDYGIVPMPMLDENQSGYSTYAHDGFSVFGIPSTCLIPETSAAYLEAMCAESYRSVMPSYFETAIKVKYSRDDLTSEMLDIIIAGVRLDIAYVYSNKLGSVCAIFRDIFLSPANCGKAMSTVASKEKSVNSALTKLIAAYDELD
jgi:ABC-type glycerol-3-phosphate transport system substrate-binding protein